MRPLRLLSLVLLPLLLAAAASAQADARPGVAVFPFSIGGARDTARLDIGLQQVLTTELAQRGDLRVVERAALRDLLAEQDLGASGRIDEATAAGIGRMVGARYAVLGTWLELGGRVTLDARVVDVETSRLVTLKQRARVQVKGDRLFAAMTELARLLEAGLELPALERAQQPDRRALDVPDEAIRRFSRAQRLQDAGDTEGARALYRELVERFPAFAPAREALAKLER